MHITKHKTTINPPAPKSLESLCEEWRSTRPNSLPGICHDYIDHEDGGLQVTIIQDTSVFSPVHQDSDSLGSGVIDHMFDSYRNISMVAVLVSVLIVLVIIALIMCLRRRKSYFQKRNNDYMGYRMRHLNRSHLQHHQLPSSMTQYPVDIPPTYHAVMMIEEEEDTDLPSYDEALVENGVTSLDNQQKYSYLKI